MMSPLKILRPLAAGAVIALLALSLHAQSADELIARGRSERDAGRLEAAAALFRRASEIDPSRADAPLLLGETLGWQKNFAEAEIIYRAAIDRFGASRDARLGLGRTLLWIGKYAEARRVLSSILDENPADLDAREERARTFYWSGDFRAAAREFQRVLALDGARAASKQALEEIRAGSSPAFAVRAFHRSDDQPVSIQRAAIDLSFFSDPLTRWAITAGSWQLDDGADAPFFGVETDVPIPSLRLTVAPSLRLLRFPDSEEELLGGVRVARKLGGSASISAGITRGERLLNARAADDHPFVTEAFVQYDVATGRGLLARARAGSSRFYDDNDGAFADAYVLAPLRRTERVTIAGGLSAAYRDTDESRFQFERVDVASGTETGGFSYRWRGVYDPYWTPLGLREVRAIASAGSPAGSRIFWNVQLTGGRARDRGVSFGPAQGGDATPPAPFPSEYPRAWNPWTAAATLEIPAGRSRLRFDYEHTRNIYYEADEFRAALVGRF